MNLSRLLVASSNPRKLDELKELLSDIPIKLISLEEFSNIVEVEEDAETFQDNAEKKALGFARQTGCLTVADDSGLSVEYLRGMPGILSARFAGPDKNDFRNCEKLLYLMKNVPHQERKATFFCAVSLATPLEVIATVEDSVIGSLTEQMRGEGGFGYDPLFFYPEFGKTFAEVPSDLKHSVSHRGKALRRMKELLKIYLKGGT